MNRIDHPRRMQLEVDNEGEYLLYLGSSPLAQRSLAEEVGWVITGVDDNTFNGVLWTRLDDKTADTLVPQILEQFRTRDVPALWRITPETRPADLGKRLEALGCFQLTDMVSMTIDLSRLNEDARSIPELVVQRVSDAETLARWCSIYDPDDERREPLWRSLGFGDDKPLQHYLALLDGEPVGTSALFMGKEAAGLYHVEVIPPARRRGIGTALALAPLQAARAHGYRFGVVAPSPESLHLYARLGFELHPTAYDWYAA